MKLVVLASVVLLGLAACADGGEEADAGTGNGTAKITVQIGADPEEAAVYRSLVTAYRDGGGGEVELVTVGRGDHLTRLSTAFASGGAPDVFAINYRQYAPLVQRGAVRPIGPLLEAEGLKLSDYYEEPLRAFSYVGALQCMPQNISSLVVYWNRGLFTAANVAAPKAGWTWNDFTATAKALTTGEVKGAGIDSAIIRMAPFIWSNGGTVVDNDETPTRTTLHEPAARAALDGVAALIASGAMPTKEQLAAQGLPEQFMAGKLAMFLSSRVEVPALREQAGLDFDVAALPVLGKPASILHSDAYCVASGSANPAAAAKFVAYAVGQQGQNITALGGRTVPSLRSVATSPAFLSPTRAPASSQVFLDAVAHLRHTPVTPSWPEVEDVIDTQLQRAFEDGVPLDEVIAEIQKQADPLLQRR
ncbi:MAG TPA: sugar ABC transporter substrate-binding protein [Actinophytocola sp.]|uniref:ABC transporter substrate-binding protein n=1 Tax=Actinophytocola sp. TaxID=1872138 RepID=UPI002DBBFA94|nr:sugar ABC transporter substrate-binding protein [Actinophytocola sp.]HEU5471353.1 sugar ABC transporter substrate-binding protein [Actinophytocola sp.]